MKTLAQIFISFFKTGLFTFGGGYAVLPMLKNEIVTKHRWFNEDELLNYFSISECTPGIIAVNMAIFCGYKLKKALGAFIAAIAVILPSIIITLLVAGLFGNLVKSPLVEHALNGIRIGVAAMLIKVVYDTGKRIWQNNAQHLFTTLIYISAMFGLIFYQLSAVTIVVCGLAIGCGLLLKNRLFK